MRDCSARARAPTPLPAAAELDGRDQLEFSDARFDSDLLADDARSRRAISRPAGDATPARCRSRARRIRNSCAAPSAARAGSGRGARGAGRRGRVAARCVLVLQVGNHFRDAIAARWPALRRPLVAWCAPGAVHDRGAAPDRRHRRRKHGAHARAGPDAFRLAVTLRSRASMPVAMPSVDLSLTDSARQAGRARACSRRATSTGPRRAAAATAKSALQTLLRPRPAPVAGYTVEIFYP